MASNNRDSVTDSYSGYLDNRYSRISKEFKKRRQHSPESAMAEAVVFCMLQHCGVNPAVSDIPNIGGPDFVCTPGTSEQFLVEATTFQPDKVTRATGVSNQTPEDLEAQWYSLMTPEIDWKVSEKIKQFRNIQMPGVLAIVSSHFAGSLAFDLQAAQRVLISSPFYVALQTPMSTDFAASAFLRIDEQKNITTRNPDISAILLVTASWDRCFVCGTLNPNPSYQFKPQLMAQIPFVALRHWPMRDGKAECIWTMDAKRPYEMPYASIHSK